MGNKQNTAEIVLSAVVFTSLWWLYLGKDIPGNQVWFAAIFFWYSLIIGLLAIWEKKKGRGSWFEVVIAFLVIYGYEAVFGGVKQIPGLNPYSYALFVSGFWVLFNSADEIKSWLKSKMPTIERPKTTNGPTVPLTQRLGEAKTKVTSLFKRQPTGKPQPKANDNANPIPPVQTPAASKPAPTGK